MILLGTETHENLHIFLFNIIILINPKYLHNTKTYNYDLVRRPSLACNVTWFKQTIAKQHGSAPYDRLHFR